jgi:two-component system OmpR family sensor kinase
LRRGGRTRGLRSRLVLAVLGVVVVGVALLVAGFNLVLDAQLERDLNGLLRARAGAQTRTLSVTNGRLEVGEAPDEGTDAQVWIFDTRRALEAPHRTAPSVAQAAQSLAGGPRRSVDVAHPLARVLAVPVRRAGRRVGTVVVAASQAPYERTERTALRASLVLAALLIVATLLIGRWLVGAALRPVARMTADAAEWSERDLDRRFSLGPPGDELTRLAATLDGLLDRLAAGLRREQRLTAEVSHELRTPLAKVSTQAQLLAGAPDLPAGLREEAEGIVRSAAQMRQVIEVLMDSARAQAEGAHGTADVASAARATVEAAGPGAAERGVTLELAGAGRALAEQTLVERMLAPLVENACRHARSSARVTIAQRGPWLEVSVEDDGQGVAAEEEAAIFEPGYRGQGVDGAHDGAGLGLSLARRLARSAGGDVAADAGADGGRFVVRLPAADGERIPS